MQPATKLAIVRALRKGAKAAKAGLGTNRQQKKQPKVKGGGACRGCPTLGRRKK